ncbi:BQ2448_8078 [Microbotryum intermedium]|uniref:BQ2448_8078 protein n=1 Tax=Microbotryum intermedium TaxID=269621 RepID=A0A238FNS6_9BASI|nr:BQ2448_8078 [Microbotryum intermedium]
MAKSKGKGTRAKSESQQPVRPTSPTPPLPPAAAAAVAQRDDVQVERVGGDHDDDRRSGTKPTSTTNPSGGVGARAVSAMVDAVVDAVPTLEATNSAASQVEGNAMNGFKVPSGMALPLDQHQEQQPWVEQEQDQPETTTAMEPTPTSSATELGAAPLSPAQAPAQAEAEATTVTAAAAPSTTTTTSTPTSSSSSSPSTARTLKHLTFDDSPTFAPASRQLPYSTLNPSTSPERATRSTYSSSRGSSSLPSPSTPTPIASTSNSTSTSTSLAPQPQPHITSTSPRRSSSSSPPPPPSSPNKKRASLTHTHQDLRQVLKALIVVVPSSFRRLLRLLIPPPLRRFASFLLSRIAMVLHRRGALASSMFYDLLVLFWKTMINIFFREIRSRGAWKVPKDGEGAVIFVVGPHHNQFLDPLLLMSEVRREAGRRISFLVAAKSMDRKFIGQAARLMQSIPVARAQDLATPGKGTITLSPDDPTIVIGHGATEFTKSCAQARSQIMLPRSLGSVSIEIAEVMDDHKLRLKKEFNKKVRDGWKDKGAEGVAYKVLPYVDQSKMYSSVYQKLTEGGSIGIFPEGGSHDRTDLLPLKAGVSIMALGALSADPNLRLQIVPVGLSYFHPHKFRSRAVVEFGTPIDISSDSVRAFERGGDDKKKAIGDVMDLVVDGLKSVTVRAPDYETLMLIQATRRLYRPPGQYLTLGQIVELNKRFIAGYEVYRDDPRLKQLMARVKEYNTLLRYMGLKDHQIERVARPFWRSFVLLCYRLGLFGAWSILALPGVVLNAPIFIAAKIISRRKAKEALAASTVKIKGKDVLATWKVLVALTGAPTLYTIYAIGATVLARRLHLEYKYQLYAPIATLVGLPLIGISALKFGEVGMDVYKSIRPLLLSVLPGNHKQLDKLRAMRSSLQLEINQLVEELAPKIFEDFQTNRVVQPSAKPAPVSEHATKRRSTYGPQGQGTFLTHPLSWVDEYLFGWSAGGKGSGEGRDTGMESDEGAKSGNEDNEGGRRSGYASGYTTEDPDYDEVINILSREQGHASMGDGAASDAGTGVSASSGVRKRRGSRSRSRSQLDLTALNKNEDRGKHE